MKALQAAGHVPSVILPDTQRSWIGKAHIRGTVIQPKFYRPTSIDEGDPPTRWILVNGTPASCVQLGLFHLFQDRGPVDLVIAGPNYGRNATSISNLCSGTVGAALEAAICKRKAIALSYAFVKDKRHIHDPEVIEATSKAAAKLIEQLFLNWDAGVELYNINMPPLQAGQEVRAVYTTVLRRYWNTASIYEELEEDGKSTNDASDHDLKPFKWAPKKHDVQKLIDESLPGTDGWALKQGYIRFVNHEYSMPNG